MQAYLARLQRPSMQELGEYQLGLLSPERAQEVAAYLKWHPHAAAQVAELQNFLPQAEPAAEETGLWDKVRVLMAQVSGLTLTTAVRGSGPQIFQIDDMRIVVESDRDQDNPDRRVLFGAVSDLTLIDPQVRVWSVHEPGQAVTAVVDENGNFECTGLPPGQTMLILSGQEQMAAGLQPVEIYLPLLEIE